VLHARRREAMQALRMGMWHLRTKLACGGNGFPHDLPTIVVRIRVRRQAATWSRPAGRNGDIMLKNQQLIDAKAPLGVVRL